MAVLTLIEKQQLFTRLLVRLLDYAHSAGCEVVLGEVYRPPETAALYHAQGRGVTRSLHAIKLAADLLLFRHGIYLRDSADYQRLGEYWESLHPGCCWGGRFARVDGGHFSLTHEGIR